MERYLMMMPLVLGATLPTEDISALSARVRDYGPQLLAALPVVLAVLFIAFVVNVGVARILRLTARRLGMPPREFRPIAQIARWAIWTVATILCLSILGFSMGGLWAVLSAVLGLIAIGFIAVWSIISHATATVLLLFLRPFRVGDDLAFTDPNHCGRVIDLNFFYTTLLRHDEEKVYIPNNLFFQQIFRRHDNHDSTSLGDQLHAPLPANLAAPPKVRAREGGP